MAHRKSEITYFCQYYNKEKIKIGDNLNNLNKGMTLAPLPNGIK
jgi:hypothetical protein